MAVDITLTDEQSRAVDKIVDWFKGGGSEFYLAGYAGVGKSTVAKFAIEAIGAERVCTATFTGKAANVLRQKGVPDAMTIHSATYKPSEIEEEIPGSGGRKQTKTIWSKREDGAAAKAQLIVCDEVSMLPQFMADDLRSFGVPILVMGDPGQLPPIEGRGAFINREPDVLLETIHRQAADSPILKLATMARMGERIPFGEYGPDVRVLPLTNRTVEAIFNPDAQVLCGVHRVRWKSTQMIRTRRGVAGVLPVPGERIICRRNNAKSGIFNGSMGTLVSIKPNEVGVQVLSANMDDLDFPVLDAPIDPYLFEEHFGKKTPEGYQAQKGFDLFDWGWVLTTHSAQGSEWPEVVVIDDSDSFRGGISHKHRYTSITRASKKLTILRRQ